MKTKTIFKALAFVIMMPAMLLTTACSSDDSIINDESTNKKGYPLPVTVNVTRQGDKANTRATYNETTKKLEFSDGDQLFVNGYDGPGAGHFAGILTMVSEGKFSGTIYTQNAYSGTADELFTTAFAAIRAQLLPAGYENYHCLSTESNDGYNATLLYARNMTFAPTKAEAVEQFSLELASTYSSGFALSPQNAILCFTITGLTPSTNVTASLSNGSSFTINGNVTTDGAGNATFAMGIAGGKYDLKDFSLTVGGTEIALTSSSKPLVAGHIYNITRSAVASSSVEIVTWNFSGKSGIVDLSQGEGYTEGGVTLSGSGTLDLDNGNLYIEDEATFSNSLNKKFKSIDISPANGQLLNWVHTVSMDGEYWAWSNVNGATYVYFYSSDTFKSQATGIKTIVFTLE